MYWLIDDLTLLQGQIILEDLVSSCESTQAVVAETLSGLELILWFQDQLCDKVGIICTPVDCEPSRATWIIKTRWIVAEVSIPQTFAMWKERTDRDT